MQLCGEGAREMDTENLQRAVELYTVKDLEDIFKIGQTQAYALMNSSSFPSFRINRRLYVEAEQLKQWVNTYKGKQFIV